MYTCLKQRVYRVVQFYCLLFSPRVGVYVRTLLEIQICGQGFVTQSNWLDENSGSFEYLCTEHARAYHKDVGHFNVFLGESRRQNLREHRLLTRYLLVSTNLNVVPIYIIYCCEMYPCISFQNEDSDNARQSYGPFDPFSRNPATRINYQTSCSKILAVLAGDTPRTYQSNIEILNLLRIIIQWLSPAFCFSTSMRRWPPALITWPRVCKCEARRWDLIVDILSIQQAFAISMAFKITSCLLN